MMWDQVIARLASIVETDATLVGIFSGSMRMAGTGVFQIPSLEWSLIGDTQSELYAPHVIQFDLWSEDPSSVIRAERRLRALFDQSLPATFEGLTMDCLYIDGSMLATPDRDGFVGRAIRFRFTPLRAKYALETITHTP